MINRSFIWGVVFTAGGMYAYHHWVKPLPGAAK